MAKQRYYDGDTFEYRGLTMTVSLPFDDSCEPPWEELDGTGQVSEWTTRDKRPGERVLCSDRSHKRYYDFQEAVKRAKSEGWNAPPFYGPALDAWVAEHGRHPTEGERAANAAEHDFKWLKAYCDGDWSYIGVVVSCGKYDDSIWGVESTATDTINEYIDCCADNVARQVWGNAMKIAEFKARDAAISVHDMDEYPHCHHRYAVSISNPDCIAEWFDTEQEARDRFAQLVAAYSVHPSRRAEMLALMEKEDNASWCVNGVNK